MDKFLKKTNDNTLFQYRYAVTFGEVAIFHIGGTEFGTKIRDEGYTVNELQNLKNFIGDNAEYISLDNKLPENLRRDNEAGVLVIRCSNNPENTIPISTDFADKLYEEQLSIDYDDKYYDNRFQKILHKRARKNIVFGNTKIEHSEDYKQPSVKSFGDLYNLSRFKNLLPSFFGKKAEELNAEGNFYNHSKSGIGFHGDTERKIVICLSLGKSAILRFQWRLPFSSEHTCDPIDININHGDIYIMSEKASGFDWKSRSKVRVVHASGHEFYINK